MRVALTEEIVVSYLLMVKTCLMLLKPLSIPRGELMGCQLAVRLVKIVCEQLDINMRAVTCLIPLLHSGGFAENRTIPSVRH